MVFNGDPLLGTVGNMMRYLVLSVDIPEGVNTISRSLFGITPSTVLDLFYDRMVAAFIGSAGTASVFIGAAGAGGGESWFGPVGFLLVLPAMAYSLWRGPRRLKATALAMLAYWMLICLIVAWQPQNVRLMTAFFVSCGFFTAFFLPPWRIGHHGRLVLQVLGIAQIAHALMV